MSRTRTVLRTLCVGSLQDVVFLTQLVKRSWGNLQGGHAASGNVMMREYNDIIDGMQPQQTIFLFDDVRRTRDLQYIITAVPTDTIYTYYQFDSLSNNMTISEQLWNERVSANLQPELLIRRDSSYGNAFFINWDNIAKLARGVYHVFRFSTNDKITLQIAFKVIQPKRHQWTNQTQAKRQKSNHLGYE